MDDYTDFGSNTAGQFANVTPNGNVDYASMNKGVTPVFFVVPIEDQAASEEAGAPRLREQEMVRIHVAGDMLNVATSPITVEIKERFAEQYEAWKTKRVERLIVGTPLQAWPLINTLLVAQYAAVNVFSVEDLAAISDSNIARLQDGRVWREKAMAWLAASKDGAVAAKFAAENERMRGEMADMKAQIAELSALAEQATKPRNKAARDAA